MPKEKKAFDGLKAYLPEGSFDLVMPFIYQYKIELTLTRARKTILGNYRHPWQGKGHRISINANLNKYSFLITLLHELAHLFTWEKYGNKVASHGKEWKAVFSEVLRNFVVHQIFPSDINAAIKKSIHNPAASSCADETLLRVLKNYDARQEHLVFIETLPINMKFALPDGRIFIKGEKLRKRYKCMEEKTGKFYLFSPVYEVAKARD